MQQSQRSGDFIDFQGKTTRKIIYFLTKRLNSMVIVQRTKIPCLFFQDRARPIGDSPDRFVGKTRVTRKTRGEVLSIWRVTSKPFRFRTKQTKRKH